MNFTIFGTLTGLQAPAITPFTENFAGGAISPPGFYRLSPKSEEINLVGFMTNLTLI